MDDLLNEFLTETAESMDQLDVELVKLEQNPNDQQILSSIFRMVHTIKGTCGFLGLPRLESVAHASENVLGKIRDGELEVTADRISLVLESLDQIKALLAALEATEAEPEGEDTDLIARLNHLAETGEVPGAPDTPAAEPEPETGAEEEAPAEDSDDLQAIFDATEYKGPGDPLAAKKIADAAASGADADDGPVAEDNDALQAIFDATEYKGPGDPLAAKKQADAAASADHAEAHKAAPRASASGLPARTGDHAPAPAETDKRDDHPVERKEGGGVIQTIRVNVDLLENLMTMVSELVLTRNQLLQILRSQSESEFGAPLQRLSHVTSELQEGVMKTRMQPIGNAWAKLPRIVRDLSVELHKKIDLQMIGAETELDRQVLEIIRDPLTHMVRNSADHGIETPDVRAAAGKSETGTITLNAYHEGGHILIQIKDDGKGLALSKIKEKALNNGLTTESELEGMTEHQVQQFIFAAGFSTAASVTSVSGRGVGMDVVKSNIDKIGGTVELTSVEGQGTTFTIKIPLTLAIVNALIVECSNERFAIPQISVVELVRASNDGEHKIERIHGTPVLRLRDKLLPLVTLRKLLDMEGDDGAYAREAYIVVSQVGAYTFGIIVDRIYDAEEIVVKPTASILRNLPIFGGNTILGDGSVIMILDPNGIAQTTGEIAVADQRGEARDEHMDLVEEDRVALLLFRAGGAAPKAVPLGLVARLEEVDFGSVEYSNGRAMIQYRGVLMPLVPIRDGIEFPKEGKRPTLVFTDRERSMGLVVDEILDIVEDRLSVELSDKTDGMLGSAIVAGKATEILDTTFFLTKAFPDWFAADRKAIESGKAKRSRLLLVDDSAFFRNLLTPMLSVAGYAVTSVESAEQALELYERGDMFDAIVSDIEMPGMSGFDLVEKLRAGGRWANVPIVAVSSHTEREDLERGHAVGFTDYVAKHDRDGLLAALEESAAGSGYDSGSRHG
ncbi:chemotaxis protein CheW [Marivibrio halodurans]|uniref:Chemotaxis protein CheA n=1 Tax=Marivibrio halodurans TaxID=2039722 RepID=A0A8J7SK95_9PROT|nr:chemotaxis protein CheW [Marivibrio halodurans]MBP5856068.1 chemotaxis protein CheW [Marivibrio halodurans]